MTAFDIYFVWRRPSSQMIIYLRRIFSVIGVCDVEFGFEMCYLLFLITVAILNVGNESKRYTNLEELMCRILVSTYKWVRA